MMDRISVLIPDADLWGFNVARCLAVSRQVVLHGFALSAAPTLRYSGLFGSFEEYKGRSGVKGWLARIGQIVEDLQIDVVLPTSEFAIRTLSKHRQVLSWAAKLSQLPNPHTFDIATDKATLAEFLRTRGLPHPPTAIVNVGILAHDDLSALEFPVLAKPSLGYGGRGIRPFESQTAVTGFLAERPIGERWVVQSYIEGRDVDVNVLCRDGQIVAATVQHAIKASSKPFQPAIGIEFRDDSSAMHVAEKLMGELGWSGIAHIDMRLGLRRKTPLVLEINGRYWNSLLGSLNAGVNFPLLACEMSLGEARANRTPRSARYFSGKDSSLLSLLGGGKYRIKPHETNLRYFKPLPAGFRLLRSAANAARNWRGE